MSVPLGLKSGGDTSPRPLVDTPLCYTPGFQHYVLNAYATNAPLVSATSLICSGVDPSVFCVFEHPHNFGR